MTAPAKPRWLEWLPLLGMVLTVAGLIWAAANYAAKVDDATRRIQQLEDRSQKRDDASAAIDARLARIEGKIDLMGQTK